MEALGEVARTRNEMPSTSVTISAKSPDHRAQSHNASTLASKEKQTYHTNTLNTDLGHQMPISNLNNFGNASFIDQSLILPKKEEYKFKKKNTKVSKKKMALQPVAVQVSSTPARWSA